MDPRLDYTRESSTRYQQVLVQEPYGLGNAARAVTSRRHWRAVLAPLRTTLELVAREPGAGLLQLCKLQAAEDLDARGNPDLSPNPDQDSDLDVARTLDWQLNRQDEDLAKNLDRVLNHRDADIDPDLELARQLDWELNHRDEDLARDLERGLYLDLDRELD
jgi:hypothetical protein